MNKIIGSLVFLFLLMERISCLPLATDNDIKPEGDNRIESETESPEEFIDLTVFNSSIFGKPDKNTGEILTNWSPDEGMNPEEMGSYLEGDILIPHGSGRNGLVAQSSRWQGGVIPYVIQGSFNAFQMDLIERGIKEYHAKTCLRFKPRTNERDYVAVVNDNSGCWSSVGRVGGRQEVNLQTPACLSKVGTFIHEMMHAIGFFHEQNRYDRDSHVSVKYENIVAGTTANFDKTSSNKAHAFGVSYDYGSVMHYSAYAFSKNGNPTIVPTQAHGRNQMGQRDGFSGKDIDKINKMYNCHRTYAGSGETSSSSGTLEGPSGSGSGISGSGSGSPGSGSISPGSGSGSSGSGSGSSTPSRPGFNIPFLPVIGNVISGILGIFGEEQANQTRIAIIDVPAIEENGIGAGNMLL